MKKLILGLVGVALLAPALSFGAFWKADENVSITALQPIQENAYLAANNLTVSAEISGDLFAAGNAVSISGNVSRDIMAAGSLVNIFGAKAEDVRVAGSNVNLGGAFSGELLAAGAQVMVTADTQIARDSYLIGSILTFNGKGAGDVSLSGEKVEFNGSAGGNLVVKTSQVLVIGPDAVVKGNLDYSSPMEAVIDPGAQISGKVNYTATQAGREGARKGLAAAFTGIFFIKLLAMLLAAYLLWYLRRKDSEEVVQLALSKFGASLLRGFIFMVVVPAGMIVLLFTVIGFPIAIFSGLVYAAFLMLAAPFTILFAAALLMKKKISLQWYHILLAAVVLAVLMLIPLIGGVLIFIAYLASLGALITVLRAKFKR